MTQPRTVVVVPGPAYRPAAYRPPPLRPAALGQTEIKLQWGNIGQTILFASAGAGAVYGSTLLPDPVKTVGMVAGIGLLGYAAYSFLGSETAKLDTKVRPETGFRIPTKAEFAQIKGKIISPEPGTVENFNFWSQTYDVKVQLSNPNPTPVTVGVQLIAHEQPLGFGLIPLKSEDYVALDEARVLEPNSTYPITLLPSARTNRWVANIDMRLTLRIVRQAGEVADLDHVDFVLRG